MRKTYCVIDKEQRNKCDVTQGLCLQTWKKVKEQRSVVWMCSTKCFHVNKPIKTTFGSRFGPQTHEPTSKT